MVTQVNGTVRAGEFITSNLDFFTIVTVVPCFPTRVKAPLSTVLAALNATALSATKSVTVNGVTYSSNETYTDALAKQSNLDALLSVFSTRANPVIVNAYSQQGTNVGTYEFVGFSDGTAFGADYDAADPVVYTVKLVSEKAGSWYVGAQGNYNAADGVTAITANDTNLNGYQFLTALNGTPVTDLTAPVVLGSKVFRTDNTGEERNTIGVRDADLIRKSDVLITP
jgi:hypothetical protein